MIGESDQSVLLIQIDASSIAKFEICEFEISRVDYITPVYNGVNLQNDEGGGAMRKVAL